jgi:hypothetical protein
VKFTFVNLPVNRVFLIIQLRIKQFLLYMVLEILPVFENAEGKPPYCCVKCAVIAECCNRKDEHFNITQPPGKYIDLFIYTSVAQRSQTF